ncbi:MAG: hypothetical protein K0R03_1817 [Moraxellaceae bacterium]|jgi:predicted DCC family thiol-disulfide oxidoreductase YuxK|nr:hypothetical protein [Moraxellaceae bacterium]
MKSGWTGGQYSLFRILFGIYLFVHFALLLPWAAEVFSSDGMLADASHSPLMKIFPNLLALADSPPVIVAFVLSATVAALAFAAGWKDKWAAAWLWYVLACLFTRNPLIANPALPYVGWMLLAHLFIPAAPYGAVDAVGRADPAGSWFMPRSIFRAAAIVLALSYSYSGYTKLLSPSWVEGQTLGYVLENPLARDWFLREVFLGLPAWLLSGITWFILYVELLYAPLALVSRLKPWLWTVMLLVQFGFLFLLDFPDLTFGMLLFHLLTLDPDWLPARSTARETIYYDGGCGLCHRVVRFVLSEDRGEVFRFAPLQGELFREAIPESVRKQLPDSFVVVTADGEVLTRSTAALHLLRRLGGLWLLLASLLQWLPKVVRDGLYRLVGANRHHLFSRPDTACPLLTPALQHRFVMDVAKEAA